MTKISFEPDDKVLRPADNPMRDFNQVSFTNYIEKVVKKIEYEINERLHDRIKKFIKIDLDLQESPSKVLFIVFIDTELFGNFISAPNVPPSFIDIISNVFETNLLDAYSLFDATNYQSLDYNTVNLHLMFKQKVRL